MNEIRKDPLSDSWVLVASERLKRPQFIKIRVEQEESELKNCPFCYGNEKLTPPEIFAIRPDNSPPDSPGWLTRVFPNKFPALKVELNPEQQENQPYTKIGGCGAHEVIVETPEHFKKFSAFSPQDFFNIFSTFQHRIRDLKRDRRLVQIMIFKNSGALAGATLSHAHCQLIALPIISAKMEQRLRTFNQFRQNFQTCLLCKIAEEEIALEKRIVNLNERIIIFAPYASRFSFELQILPRRHRACFEDEPEETISELAAVFSGLAKVISRKTEIDDFNLILNTAPAGINENEFHWSIEFFPQLNRLAAFEWGSGFYINPILPEEVARVLNFQL